MAVGISRASPWSRPVVGDEGGQEEQQCEERVCSKEEVGLPEGSGGRDEDGGQVEGGPQDDSRCAH